MNWRDNKTFKMLLCWFWCEVKSQNQCHEHLSVIPPSLFAMINFTRLLGSIFVQCFNVLSPPKSSLLRSIPLSFAHRRPALTVNKWQGSGRRGLCSGLPRDSSRFKFIRNVHVPRPDVKLPLPKAQHTTQHWAGVDSDSHVNVMLRPWPHIPGDTGEWRNIHIRPEWASLALVAAPVSPTS